MSTVSIDVRLAVETWEALMTAHARLTAEYAAESIWGDASMREYDVLYTLAKSARPLRLSELQEDVLLSQPALSRMVDRLVSRGLIAREQDPADGRAILVSLTDTGAETQRSVGRPHARSVARRLSEALSPDEMRTLEAICTKLVRGAQRTEHDEHDTREGTAS